MCRALIVIFALLYAAALALLAIGTFGWFGQQQDPLGGVFLVPLGLPWNILLNAMPEPFLPWIGVGAPALNLMILWALCRLMGARR